MGVHARSIRSKGCGGYFKHYFQPIPVLFPLNFIEEIVKPFTLALRLFGNIFAGGIMLAIIGLIPVWVTGRCRSSGSSSTWSIGVIQAFIFALLTVLYYAQASESHANETEALLETEEDSEGQRRRTPADPARPRSTSPSSRASCAERTDRITPPPADTRRTDAPPTS